MKLLWRIILHISLIGTVCGGLTVAATMLYLEPTLPPASEIQNIDLQVPMRIYTQDGKLLGEFGEKRRTPITYNDVPQTFVKAVLAAEDSNFFEHNGIDFKGLIRAFLQLLTTGEIRSGGSTITMQLAKNYFLTFDKLFSRKLTEILLALKLEQQLSKEEIFELYVNKIFLGKRAYGVQAAAQIYYGKNISELNTAQLAMIAGLPKAPSAYNPIANPTRAMERRDWILSRMYKLAYIDESQYQEAIQEPLTASLYGPVVEVNAPYIAEMVRSDLINKYGLSIYTRGVSVYTTIDSALQEHAQEALKRGLKAYDERHGYRGPEDSLPANLDGNDTSRWLKHLANSEAINEHQAAIITGLSSETANILFKDGSEDVILWKNLVDIKNYVNENRRSAAATEIANIFSVGDLIRVKLIDDEWHLNQLPNVQGALVSLDAKNGALKALVGGYDFYLSNFNRATQAQRQPGSNFKPFMYALAMESGFTPASLINDAPIVYKDEGLENLWRPDNASDKFYGPTPLRKALYLSRNVVSVRLMQALGVSKVADFATKFGFAPKNIPRNLSLSLGTLTASPLEVARAYAVFANNGFLIKPHWIDKIIDDNQEIIFEAKPAVACTQCETSEFEILEEVEDEFALLDTIGFEEMASNDEALTTPENLAERVLDARSTYLINSILQDTVNKGTATRAKSLGRSDLAGKTGTTNGPTDAWFSGFNSDIVTTAWVGFDSYENLGRGEYGGSAALPIWIDYMEQALANLPEKQRPRPLGIVSTLINPDTGLRVRPGTAGATFEIFRSDFLPEFQEYDQDASYGEIENNNNIEESSLF